MATDATQPGSAPAPHEVTTKFPTGWGLKAIQTMREELGDSIVSDVERLDYDPESLRGRVAFITGATSGIGRATAELFASHGAKVVIVGRDEKRATETRDSIVQAGADPADVMYILGDMTKPEEAQDAVTRAVDKFGRIDIGVLNAGINDDVGILEMEPNQWYDVTEANLRMTVFPAQAIARQMVTQTGEGIPAKSLIFMGSISDVGNPGQPNYSASKAGINSLARAIAREVKLKDVSVGLFRPGFVDTELIQGMPERSQKLLRYFASKMPKGEMIQPEEAAVGVAYLATRPDSGHVLTLT